MSCGSGGCGSCGTEKGTHDVLDKALLPTFPSRQTIDARPLVLRIQHVAAKLRVQLELEHDAEELVDDSQTAEFSLLFNDIAVTLASGNAQAVKVNSHTHHQAPHTPVLLSLCDRAHSRSVAHPHARSALCCLFALASRC